MEKRLPLIDIFWIESPVIRNLDIKLGKEMTQLVSSLNVIRQKQPIGGQYNRPLIQIAQIFG